MHLVTHTLILWKSKFGKICTVFSPKSVVLVGLTIFVSGSLLCTLAQSSKMFIIGRAICGLGVSAIDNSTIALITHLFPRHKRSSWLTWSGTAQSVGLACAPVLGGALIDRFSWSACFGINLPLCPLLIIFTIFFLEDPIANPNYALPLKKKLRMIDLPGTLIIVPSVTCLLIALQFGGIRFGWGNGLVIALFVLFAGLALGFAYLQYRLGDKASIPGRIIKRRSILAAFWFSACCNGLLAMTEYYISVYWQGVRNETALKSGLLTSGLIIGLFAGSMLSGFGIPKVGYFTRKLTPTSSLSNNFADESSQAFMLATSLMAPIASGLLTTISLDEGRAHVVAVLAFLGFAVGIGINGPIQATSRLLAANEVSIGAAIVFFGGGLGSPLFISASAALFQNRLTELPQRVPGLNITGSRARWSFRYTQPCWQRQASRALDGLQLCCCPDALHAVGVGAADSVGILANGMAIGQEEATVIRSVAHRSAVQRPRR